MDRPAGQNDKFICSGAPTYVYDMSAADASIRKVSVADGISAGSSDRETELTARVEALEKELESVKRSKERETTLLNQRLLSKTDATDILRLKVNRYEFAIKEAILFLGKPMLSFEGWVMNGSRKGREERSHSQDSARPQSREASTSSHSNVEKSLPAQMAEKQQAQQNPDFNAIVSTEGNIPLASATNLEVQCMECMRLALIYLKNAQASVQSMTKEAGGPSLPTLSKSSEPTGASSMLNAELPDGNTVGSSSEELKKDGHQRSTATTSSRSVSPNRSSLQTPQDTTVMKSGRGAPHERSTSAQKAAAAVFKAATSLPEDDDSDLANNRQQQMNPTTPTMAKCSSCRDMMLQLHHLQETIDQLKMDITDLADQLEDEKQVRDRLQLSKDILDQELEELTAQLFDQANRMVVDEARMRDELEHTNSELRGELKEVMSNFQRRDEELRQLRHSLRALEAAKLRSTSSSSLNHVGTSPLGSHGSLSGSRSSLSARRPSIITSSLEWGSNTSIHTLHVDGIVYAEFQEHVKETMLQLPQLLTAMSTQFLKRCMAEDVEPCLFYIYHPEAGTLFKQGTGLSTSAKKRLLDNLVRGWCEVSLHTKQRSSRSSGQGKTPSSPLSAPQQPVNAMPRASGQSAIRQKCHSCALHRDCDYRVRFGPPRSAASDMQRGTAADDTWQPICRFCKDRLLSVGDFFSFLSRLREGVKQGASILSMFRQALLLRRRMSASRIGSISLFELEGYASRLELNTDWEKCVQIHS